jgi:hypothetical protein
MVAQAFKNNSLIGESQLTTNSDVIVESDWHLPQK